MLFPPSVGVGYFGFSAVLNWSRTELYSSVETRLQDRQQNVVKLPVLQRLSHVWWHYKQDKLRQRTHPYVHRE